MNGLLLVIQTISDFLWGTPMTIALIGTGLYLSIKFKFRYITKIKFHFQNTFGKMFKGKGEGEGTVSGFAAACTAMANTIGVGNIGGVATAITMGVRERSSGCGSLHCLECLQKHVRSFLDRDTE